MNTDDTKAARKAAKKAAKRAAQQLEEVENNTAEEEDVAAIAKAERKAAKKAAKKAATIEAHASMDIQDEDTAVAQHTFEQSDSLSKAEKKAAKKAAKRPATDIDDDLKDNTIGENDESAQQPTKKKKKNQANVIRFNYVVHPSTAALSSDEITAYRSKLEMAVYPTEIGDEYYPITAFEQLNSSFGRFCPDFTSYVAQKNFKVPSPIQVSTTIDSMWMLNIDCICICNSVSVLAIAACWA